MPEITATHVALLAISTALGAIVGWFTRRGRAAQEKAAINAGWQEQIESYNSEHERLVSQNRGLMSQISHLQSSNKDARKRTTELSADLKDAIARHDDLQHEIKNVRSSLETAVTRHGKRKKGDATQAENSDGDRQKDLKIFQLSRELEKWQKRLPPLIERYRVRNEEALQLEAELISARRRIEELTRGSGDMTRVEAVRDPDALTDGRTASNDPADSMTGPAVASEEHDDDYPKTLRDDLQAIKGVGPAIERTLNELGIFRYQQIADMSDYDVDRIARRLNGIQSRIYRENWIGQARELSSHSDAV